MEVDTHTELAARLEFLRAEDVERAQDLACEVIRMLSVMIRKMAKTR
jgi:hypothetical protein